MEDIKNNGCGCGHDHSHDHDDCGCGHDHDHQYMTLQTDDGQTLKCAVIGIFDIEENDKEYIALVPEDSDEALIYEYVEHEDGEGFELRNIETEEEFEMVENAFMEMLDDEEFDEDFDDEEYDIEELDDEE